MKVSYKWLQEYFDQKLPEPKNLEDLIITKSFEVEEVIENQDDYIFDIDVLPNRAHDCLSHFGIAKEISAITGIKINLENIYKKDEAQENDEQKEVSPIKIIIQDEENKNFCKRYMGCLVENIQVGPSPIELKNKLESIGERSINNIVDITNIVMFSLGQPMHAFDKEKISGDDIYIRKAKQKEEITTLDNKNVILSEQDYVIADSESALAIAGIKGGKKAEVDLSTKDIILESANFDPICVRKTSRKLNILTESSKRFENEITPYLAEQAMDYAISLIKKYASNSETKIYKNFDYYPKPARKYITGVSVDEINSMLGTSYLEKDVINVFESLGIESKIIDNPLELIVQEAKKLIGIPYKYGASITFDSPNYFDCSSFVSYLYSLAGISIPRVSVDQLFFGKEITKDELKVGDLIFGNSEEDDIYYETVNFMPKTKFVEGVDHVGIYLGDGKVIHSSRYNSNVGVDITNIQDAKFFKKVVGYRTYFKDKETRLVLEIPHERLDLRNKSDLIEEVGRIMGYENVSDKEIEMLDFKPKIYKAYYYNLLIKDSLIKNGFSEVMTYTFVKDGEISPENPIANDKSFLRNSLEIGIKDSLEKNHKNADFLGTNTIKIFEIGNVFSKNGEKMMLGIGIKNKSGIKKPKPVEGLKEVVTILSDIFKKDISIDLHPEQEFFEIDLGEIYKDLDCDSSYIKIENDMDIKFKPISNYPYITRDIAIWIPEADENQDIPKILDIIKKHSGDFLVKEPRLFDAFSKEGRKSVAYRLVFQSYQKTLTDQEINSIMEEIYSEIKHFDKWEIR